MKSRTLLYRLTLLPPWPFEPYTKILATQRHPKLPSRKIQKATWQHKKRHQKCYLYGSFLCVLFHQFIRPFHWIWWLIYLYTTHLSCSLGDQCSDNFVNSTLLNRLYGGFLFLNACAAVSEDHRKWKLAWQSQSGIYITIQCHTQILVVCL